MIFKKNALFLKVKLTFKLKYDIYEVSRVLHMRRQRFFSSLRKHSYTLIFHIFINCVYFRIIYNM